MGAFFLNNVCCRVNGRRRKWIMFLEIIAFS